MELQTTISVVSALVSLGGVLIVVGGFVRQQRVLTEAVKDLQCEVEAKVDDESCADRHKRISEQIAAKADGPLLEQRRIDHERRLDLAHERAGEAKAAAHQIDLKLVAIAAETSAQTARLGGIESRLASIEGCLRKMNGASS